MKVLHVNYTDLPGRRFDGYDLMDDLASRGIESTMAVLMKASDDDRVRCLTDGPQDWVVMNALCLVEQRYGMNDLLFPWGRVIEQTPEFRDADVVHYHLVHNNLISVLDLPRMFAQKPAVWTMHDPWAMTGHCIYPRECPGWLSGCEPCPHLDWPFKMEHDRAGSMWRLKQRVYAELDVDIVVASGFMEDLVRRSPLTAHFERIHRIPFGVGPEWFDGARTKAEARALLGVNADDFVLMFRSNDSEFKGRKEIVEALASAPPLRPTTLLTVDKEGLLGELGDDYNIVELGWVEDPDLYPAIYSACDVFLMPSIAEAFGLMALEAMAAGRPVVCFDDTSLPSVIQAPEVGISVPMRDVSALREVIDRLSSDPDEVARRGEASQRVAREMYPHERYLDALAGLYKHVAERWVGGQ